MPALLLDGKTLAREIEAKLKVRVQQLKERTGGAPPTLATILVGDDPASHTYVAMKANACGRIGIQSRRIVLPNTASTDDVLRTIAALNDDAAVSGILLQHPTPPQVDERRCFDAIALAKDVDGVTCLGFGRLAMGEKAFHSATPGGIMTLLRHYKVTITGKNAVVVGRSAILGKPMAALLLNANATVTVCHSRTEDIAGIIGTADLVIGAVGRPAFIQAAWIKPGAVVIDAGYHPGGVGDIDLTGAAEKYAAFTPVPGGVGPMTIATLMSQTLDAAERGHVNKSDE